MVQIFHEPSILLYRDHLRSLCEKFARKYAEPRTDLEYEITGMNVRGLDDRLEHRRINQKMLTEALVRTATEFAQS